MSRIRQIAIAGATFSVALGIGFVMQNEDVLAARFGADPVPLAPPTALPVVAAADISAELPGPPLPGPASPLVAATTGLPGTVDAPDLPTRPVQLAALETDTPVTDVSPGFEALPACTIDFSGIAQPMAMARLTLEAPCAPLTSVTLHHQGMMFTVVTDIVGRAVIDTPALAQTAVFVADIFGSDGAVTVVDVPEVATIDRAVLQWQGQSGVGIHALEFGASYGEPGHIWADAPGTQAAAAAGQGGYLLRLGDPEALVPRLAEVYTFPTGASTQSGAVRLNVEAVVDETTCGREISAQSIQIAPGETPYANDLTMAVPGCDSTGEYLLLSNMLQDLTLAAR